MQKWKPIDILLGKLQGRWYRDLAKINRGTCEFRPESLAAVAVGDLLRGGA